MIDVQAIFGGDRADPLQLLGGHPPGQQGDDVPGLALAVDPLLVIVLGNRGETHLLVQLVAREQHVLEHRGRQLGVRDFDQDAERQGVVDHRLADVEDVHATLGQHAGDGRGETGAVFPGDVDQDDFTQGAASAMEKVAHSTRFRGARLILRPAEGRQRRAESDDRTAPPMRNAPRRFAPPGGLVILPANSCCADRARCDPAHLRQTR
ncbi:hypothetical protein D3C76_828720 [compost metagenome]